VNAEQKSDDPKSKRYLFCRMTNYWHFSSLSRGGCTNLFNCHQHCCVGSYV